MDGGLIPVSLVGSLEKVRVEGVSAATGRWIRSGRLWFTRFGKRLTTAGSWINDVDFMTEG
jgi:hypothetical protein